MDARQGQEIFTSRNCPERLWAHKPSYSLGTVFFSRKKRQGREVETQPSLVLRLNVSRAVGHHDMDRDNLPYLYQSSPDFSQ